MRICAARKEFKGFGINLVLAFASQSIASIELQIKDHPSIAEVVFYLFRD
jgi:hypothetical protein